MLRVLFTRRWILLTLAFIALILVMYRLGLWQYHRYQQTKRSNHQISLITHMRPVPMETLSHPGATVPGSQRYRPVTATGHFDAAHQFAVRRRTNGDGSIGFFLITPLITPDGKAVLVNRGWVAANNADGAAFPTVPKTPTGTVTLSGRLQPDETTAISHIRNLGGLPPRQYMLINSAEQAKVLPQPVVAGYLELVQTTPALTPAEKAQQIGAPGESQNTSDEAIVGQGVHLPYAIQWWLFALMVPIGWWILLRQELKDKRKKKPEPAAPSPVPAAPGPPAPGEPAEASAEAAESAEPAESAEATEPLSR